jgi:hypothetical protein
MSIDDIGYQSSYTTLMTPYLPPRTPWPDDFPEVIVLSDEEARDAHDRYLGAKSGDFGSAFWLVEELTNHQQNEALERLRVFLNGSNAMLLPVTADEAFGFNAIPDALAHSLRYETECDIEERGRIVQSNKVAHTRAPGFQRIVTPASFDGEVRSGVNYVIVDDHVGFGGTIANLRGYVMAGGANVVGVVTLTCSPNSQILPVFKSTLDVIYERYGKEIDAFWEERFGHTIACLTEREAILVSRQRSLVQLEDYLATAEREVRARGL